MADGGRNDFYAPNSSLLSDNSESMIISIDGINYLLEKNDWVDTVETAFEPDPMWGFCFQVASIQDNNIYIKVLNKVDDVYELVALDAQYITNAYKHCEAV